MAELSISAALLFLFFFLWLLPIGWLVLERTALPAETPTRITFLMALLVGAAAIALLTGGLHLFGMGYHAKGWILRGVAVLSLVPMLAPARLPVLRRAIPGQALVVCFLFFLFMVGTSAYPGVRITDVSPRTMQQLSHLAIDNLIPYNFSRTIVEDIPPLAKDVVPGWKLTDRGPFAGLVAAALFLVLDLRETSPWLGADPTLFFVFESLLVFLATLSLLAVWVLGEAAFGRRAAVCAALLLVTNYFFQVNTVFTWPKLFAAACFLVALWWAERMRRSRTARDGAYCGAFAALSLLAHESMIFGIVSLVCCLGGLLIVRAIRGGQSLRPSALLAFGACAIFLYAPWSIAKLLMHAPANRLFVNHLLCLPEATGEGPIGPVLAEYLSTHSLGEVLRTRIENILYPINFFHAWGGYLEYRTEPYALLFSISHLAFYQLLHALGVLTTILAAAALATSAVRSTLGLSSTVALGSAVVSGVALGCALATVNHAWAYPLFLVLALLGGFGASRFGLASAAIFGGAVGMNVVVSIMCWYFGQARFGRAHVEPGYIRFQLVLLSLLVSTLLWILVKGDDDRRHAA